LTAAKFKPPVFGVGLRLAQYGGHLYFCDFVLVACIMLKLKLIYDSQSVGQSVLVSGARLEPATNFCFSLKFPLDSCVFVIL
jgi:hypothetical protein